MRWTMEGGSRCMHLRYKACGMRRNQRSADVTTGGGALAEDRRPQWECTCTRNVVRTSIALPDTNRFYCLL